ncbi:MAG: hypothetical protein EOP85_09940, partial [Verrucomicrobiaceae bacterium]
MSSVSEDIPLNEHPAVNDRRLRQAMEMNRLGTWSLSPDNREIRMDERMSEMMTGQHHSSTLVLEEALQAVHPDDQARVRDLLLDALKSEGNGECAASFRVIIPGKRIRWIKLLGYTEFSNQGGKRTAVDLTGTASDATEEHQSEKLVLAQKHLLERIVQG